MIKLQKNKWLMQAVSKEKRMKKKQVKLYNIILPFWLILWFPSWIWLVIIPLNYIVDRLVFTIASKKQKPELDQKFFRKHTWKLYLIGFGSDFAGVSLLLLPNIIELIFDTKEGGMLDTDSYYKFSNALNYNCFMHPVALLITIAAIAISGLLIYIFDRAVIFKTGAFTKEQAKKIALFLALFTAPYLYLLPMQLFY